ncbi:NFX1-type zinc finger-containing protein 1-like [Xenia sp. Carnegie-2017]|uniref:NFX1-type zinc finger-containing protein 1-like n=1 Tax=Xenia sp. Carnegie-2017 TaxID=2897299 RepID=UPI001F04B365|nr:NFX1-type zinc finger-containing protein 1-like [Xenia sp. Carnegie-2017]
MSDIKNLCKNMLKSCSLTKSNIRRALSEQQLRSLIRNAPSNNRPNELASLASGKSLEDFLSRTVMCFLVEKEYSEIEDRRERFCVKSFYKAFHMWLPKREDLLRLKKLQTGFVLPLENVMKGHVKKSENDALDEDGEEDEEYVNQLLEKRMASQAGYFESSRNCILFQDNQDNADVSESVFVKISDYPRDMVVNPQIRSVENLWSLDEVQRLQFLYCLLEENSSKLLKELGDLVEKMKELERKKRELKMDKKVEMLSKKKIIGVTITGASIYHDLLHQIGPCVVIVEEAAEILEPSLLAALTSSIQNLILIGDHKQLRPQVDTYKLCKTFQFDISMMERLIESGFPYKSLAQQNRMLPEFSALLKDIYPYLKDNLPLVSKNEPLKCIEKSMFFWSHNDPESKERTISNENEAKRIVALALYLMWNGVLPSEITVLAAYKGQMKLLRKLIKDAMELCEIENITKAKRGTVDKNLSNEDIRRNDRYNFIQVQTIDMYQGDENKYVIISLVRSNDENRIGFLEKMNRRCVAQSRAKCGMYFVGNADTLRGAKNSCWSFLIKSLEDQNCLGDAIPLRCTKHSTSKYLAVNAEDVMRAIDYPQILCDEICGETFVSCEQHSCKLPCFPRHDDRHHLCDEKINDVFTNCGHPVIRNCTDDITHLLCDEKVFVELKCGHLYEKKCYQENSSIRCLERCKELNKCGMHQCEKYCGIPHVHKICQSMVDYHFPNYGHPSPKKKPCSTPITWKCKYELPITGACGHKFTKLCYEEDERVECPLPCRQKNSCGVHQCKKTCGVPHGHDVCTDLIDYVFPDCGHPSPKKKKCSEPITWKCRYKVPFTCKYNHEIQKECYQNDQEVICPVKPCGRLRKCRHPCKNACGEDFEKGECKQCYRIYLRNLEKFHENAKARVRELQKQISNTKISRFSRIELLKSGDTAAEYQKVKDQVMKFIQPCHKWFPRITKIEKVTNLDLEKKFEIAKSKAFREYIDTKFHGTSYTALRNIIREGFKMPPARPEPLSKRGMFGQGIYFATDSSKSAQEIYTKGSQALLLCRVILGKSLIVKETDYTSDKKKLRSQKCDSVYAPRGTAVVNDEFVIFDPNQALPQYIIYFSDSKDVLPPSPSIHTTESFSIKNMKPSREVNFQDPFEMYYHFAESHFRRMSANSSLQNVNITAIDIVVNKDLEQRFEATKKKFRDVGIPDNEILAYHGTDKNNIPSILQNNLQLSFARRQLYGEGNYFSEFPEVSIGYGDGLLLCRILPGKEFVDSSSANVPSGFNSKKVLLGKLNPATRACGKIIIIENSDQILPFFVVHR